MEGFRQTPEQLLKAIQQDRSSATNGRLKIFFGYAAGVGKTYAMLKAAHVAKDQGIDVVEGYVEPHARPQTAALLDGLEQIPNLVFQYNGIELREFDLDYALKRKPQLILVDELAHTNAKGCRHNKRYKDIEELLKAGIDVYTTVNVQHIESLNDTVASITGVIVRERIPDFVFDSADQVELVDIEPNDLIERLMGGHIYKKEQAHRAANNFFTVENLTALREIALRRCADRVNLISDSERTKSGREYHTDEHILVCLSSAPSNSKIVRTAAKMSNAFHGTFTALFVETPDYSVMEESDKKRLRENMRLAQQLGANIETVFGEDIAYQIAEFARLSGVSKVVLGRSNAARNNMFSKPVLTERLISYAPNLDIYIIPDSSEKAIYHEKKLKNRLIVFSLRDILKSVLLLITATCVGQMFHIWNFTEANIITVYILSVLITSVITTNRIYAIVSSLASVIIFNFLFTEPKYTLLAYDRGYPVTFIVMFIAAMITGTLAAKLKNNAKQSAQMAYRTKILFDTGHLLSKAKGKNEIISTAANQIVKLLERDVVVYLSEDNELIDPQVFVVSQETDKNYYITKNEEAVASWVLKNNKHAGATTDTLSNSKCLYLAVRVNENVYGVMGIAVQDQPLGAFENSILLSILGECALALENEKNAKEKEKAAVVAKNEQLRADLLRTISHDLRTPLTSISGNASNLISNGDSFDEETKKSLYNDIYDDSMWLINLVENLLSITKIEEGRLRLKFSAELIEEVIEEALQHVNRKSTEHEISVDMADDFIMAKMDVRLIVQVIINIVDNAIKYTQKESYIKIKAQKIGGNVKVSISDNGAGISDEDKEHIFDMFYSGTNKVADSRRSLGLGLSLCKSIITAHGGEIEVADNQPQGTIFTFSLPAEEVELHE